MAHGHPCWFRSFPACPCRPANRCGMSMRPMAGASSTRRSIIFRAAETLTVAHRRAPLLPDYGEGIFSGYFDFDRPSV